MNDVQENKLSMYFAIQKVCTDNNGVWNGLPAFVSTFGEFETVIQSIQDIRLVQEQDTKGVTQDKQSAGEILIEQALIVSTAVHAYATDVNNNTLREKVNYSPSDLKIARDTIIIDMCQLVHNEANNVLADLADYGITAAELTDLQGKLDDYEAIVAGPRDAITDRASATAELESLFVTGDDVLNNKLDKLMTQFKQSDPGFHVQFYSSRKIVDSGRPGTGLKGRVTDSATGDRIKKAVVDIPQLETGRKTNDDGTYNFKKVRPGTYSVSITAKGYEKKEIDEVVIEDGRTSELDIELVRVVEQLPEPSEPGLPGE